MYIFTCRRDSPGNFRDSMAWALSVTEKVNQISEAQFHLWSTFNSPGVGTLSWATTIEDLEVLEATNAKLMPTTATTRWSSKGPSTYQRTP